MNNIFNELDRVVFDWIPSKTKSQGRIDRRNEAMSRLFKWEQKKLNEAAVAGKWKEVAAFADAISELAFRLHYK